MSRRAAAQEEEAEEEETRGQDARGTQGQDALATPDALATREEAVRRAFPRNLTAFVIFEGIWSFGTGFVLLATTIPSYLDEIMAPKVVIQMVPQLISLLTVLQLWSGTICHGPHRLRRQFLLWLAFPACWMAFGIVGLAGWGRLPVPMITALFVVTCLGLGAAMHLGSPAYSGLVLECTPLRWRGRLAAVRNISCNLLGLGGAYLASVCKARWSGMDKFHYGFLAGAAIMAVSCAALWLVRDVRAEDAPAAPPRPIRTAGAILKNRRFRVLLAFYGLALAAGSFAPLIITYGRRVAALSTEEFTAAYCVGGVVAFLGAPLADRFGFRLLGVIGTGMLTAAFAVMITSPSSGLVVLLAAGLAGGGTPLCAAVLANLGAELAPSFSPASVIGVAAVLALPLGIAAAPLAGRLVDAYGPAGYLPAFVGGAAMGLGALAGFLLAVHEPRAAHAPGDRGPCA